MALMTKEQAKWAKRRDDVIALYEREKAENNGRPYKGIATAIAQSLRLKPAYARKVITNYEQCINAQAN